MGNEELRNANADSLRLSSLAILEEATGNPGPVQTGVIARARAKLGIAYALLGNSFEAFKESSTAVSTLPIASDAYEGANHLRDLILTLTLIGEIDLAVQNLETALSVPSTLTMADIMLDPAFEPLKENRRVQELLDSVQ
jgi:hypothetical protein